MSSSNQLAVWLQKVQFFSGLDEATISLMLDRMTVSNFEQGAYLCREGERGDRLFIIESGKVSVEKQGEKSVAVEIAELGIGDVAGTASMFTMGRRSADLLAKTNCKVWGLDHSTFRELLDAHPSLAQAVLSNLNEQLLRGGVLTAKLLSHDMDSRFRIAFFDTKSYMKAAFEEQNQNRFAIDYFDSRLNFETAPLAAGAKAVCAFVNDTLDRRVIESLHDMGVRLIAMRCAGYNNVDLAACNDLGIPVVRVPAYSPHAVAEHTVGLMLTLNRKIHQAHGRVRNGNFTLDGLVGFDLHGRTVGVVGAGKIGQCVIEILKGFGCRVLAFDKYPNDVLQEQLGFSYVPLDTVWAESDIVTLHTPLFPETRHLINREAIDKMKRGVMIINTSRGALIDTGALLAGLKSGQIGYAGLDVYEEESDYFFEDYSDRVMTDDLLARLTTFNNVLVTSHQAFLTEDALANIAETTLDNIREFIDGSDSASLKDKGVMVHRLLP